MQGRALRVGVTTVALQPTLPLEWERAVGQRTDRNDPVYFKKKNFFFYLSGAVRNESITR